jgi:hypothetical protein
MSAFGARLRRRVEQGAATMAVPPHALNRLLQDQILPRRPRRLRHLQAILLCFFDDHIDRGVVAIDLLRREPGTFAAALVAATGTHLLGPKVLLALMALAVDADSYLLLDPFGGGADLTIRRNLRGLDAWRYAWRCCFRFRR